MATSSSVYGQEIWMILRRARDLWGMIPPRPRWTLIAAVVLMALGGAANTANPLLLGRLVDSVRHRAGNTDVFVDNGDVKTVTATLLLIGLAYLAREVLQVGRRVLVEDTCTRLEKHLFVRLVAHSMMTDRSALSQEKIGTLHGRMLRNVSGSVRFLRVGFLDFLPALLAGTMALAAVVAKQPWLGLVTLGVMPISTYITFRQLTSQKGVRLKLLRCREEMDGTVVEQLGGIDH